MTQTPTRVADRPSDVRPVPLLMEPELQHYPEFARFFREQFELDRDPLGSPGLVDVGGRIYELTFIGRSGRPFPSGIEIAALVPGLEPLDTNQADLDLWAILTWIVDVIGEPWSADALATTGRIYRIPATGGPTGNS